MAVISKVSIGLQANTTGFTRGIKRANMGLSRLGSQLAIGIKRFAQFGVAAGAAAAAGIAFFTKRELAAIDAQGKFAKALNISTEALGGFELAANISGVSNEKLTKGLSILSRRVGEAQQGIGEGKRALEDMGLSGEQLSKLSLDEIFKKVADRVKGLKTNTEKAAVANQLFGRAGTELLNILNEGSAGIEKFQKRAEELGFTINKFDTQAVEDANDAFTELGLTIRGSFKQIAIAVAPALKFIGNAGVGFVVKLTKAIKENGNAIKNNLINGFKFVVNELFPAFKTGIGILIGSFQLFRIVLTNMFSVLNSVFKVFGVGIPKTNNGFGTMLENLILIEGLLANIGLTAELVFTKLALQLEKLNNKFVRFITGINKAVFTSVKFLFQIVAEAGRTFETLISGAFDVISGKLTGKEEFVQREKALQASFSRLKESFEDIDFSIPPPDFKEEKLLEKLIKEQEKLLSDIVAKSAAKRIAEFAQQGAKLNKLLNEAFKLPEIPPGKGVRGGIEEALKEKFKIKVDITGAAPIAERGSVEAFRIIAAAQRVNQGIEAKQLAAAKEGNALQREANQFLMKMPTLTKSTPI